MCLEQECNRSRPKPPGKHWKLGWNLYSQLPDPAQVRDQHQKPLLFGTTLDLKNFFRCLLMERIAGEPVNGIARMQDNSTFANHARGRFDGFACRVPRVDAHLRVRIPRQVKGEFARITSAHNPRFRTWLHHARRPHADDSPWLPVEGWKQVSDLAATRPIEALLFCDPKEPLLRPLLSRARDSACLPERLLSRLSATQSAQGVLAFFSKPTWTWQDIGSCVLYLHRVQDPGNLGALLRTSRATGCFGVVTSPETVSCYNAKVVRASAAALFSTPLLQAIPLEELRRRGYCIWAATPDGGRSLFKARFRPPLAILIGNEGCGLEATILEQADEQVFIPMQGEAESLNAAVAGSLILYEVLRQLHRHG